MNDQTLNIENLTLTIREKIGKPVSNRVVAATIESLGIRDKDTMNDFGVSSIKSLADLVYQKILTAPDYSSIKNKKEREFENNEYILGDLGLCKVCGDNINSILGNKDNLGEKVVKEFTF